MVSALISRLVILGLGTMYPAYSSYKAVKTKDVKEYVKWMMYWIVFAFFTTLETFADVLISWIPFYYELKIIFVLWLLSPATNGSSILYKKFVHPELMRREQHIDQCLDRVKTQGYSALVHVSTQGLQYAIQTAISGQAKIVDHLRKSYSMNDLTRPAVMGSRPFAPAEPRIREVDSEEDATDHGEVPGPPPAPFDRDRHFPGQRQLPPAPDTAARRPSDEDEEEEERYLQERIAEDNQYLSATVAPGRVQPSTYPDVDAYESRGYNLRSHYVPPSGSSGAMPPGRRSDMAAQHVAAAERPYIHDEGYHYGTLPRRRVHASSAAAQQQRLPRVSSGSRPALPTEWRS